MIEIYFNPIRLIALHHVVFNLNITMKNKE